MKKIILSMMAVAALAACTKSEVQYEAAGEIAFAPIASNVTKSVAGYDGDTFDGVFPTGVNLYVFANASTDDGTAWTDPYFANALFVWDTDKGTEDTQGTVDTEGAYAGNPTRYWPNVKTLKFAGYSDACNVSDLTPTMNSDLSALTIGGYVQDNTKTEEGANDLMWFPCDGTAYDKTANEIAANMRHACSWITIKVAGDAVTAGKWTLNSLVVTDLVHSGSVVCGATTATWTLDTAKADEDYYNAGTTFTDEYLKYEKNANNFIVLPQEPTNLEVNYTYVSDNRGTADTADDITLTETKSVSLDYDTAGTAWQPGVHYIYNVKITATEILIDPVVVDWTNYTGNDIEKEVE
ncbi:MAG: hypothetical protein J6S01_06395 [Bacteroidales bacterium]|nr:hypothetical protein [Bacteroidales bacterium]